MNVLNDISDDEFVPFLRGLCVETYNKSFEWMLNDPNFAGVLRWLYNNLDHNNVLTAHEEYRYNEMQKTNTLIVPDDLESAVASIQQQHLGISLPGDQETKEDIILDIHMLKERLHFLEKREAIFKDLIRKNDLTKEELTVELTRLNSFHQQCAQDEATAAEECIALAQELETITDEVIDVIADNLDVYASCRNDKEIAKRFFTFNPLDSYRHSQSLFRSHFDLYVSKNLAKRQNEITDEDLRSALAEAQNMEVRLSVAALAYVESKVELSAERAKIALVSNYNNVHASQIRSCLIEAKSALELLDQEEIIVEQQMQSTVEDFVKARTDLSVGTAAFVALNIRQQIQSSLTHLVDVWQRALALDRLLYYSLRHELRTLEDFVQFASQLRQYAVSEASAVASRIESMNEICAEHSACLVKLETTNPLLQAICTILGVTSNDASLLVKQYNDFETNVKELEDNVKDGFKKKEDTLVEFKTSMKHLHKYIWDGCTKQANCRDSTVASLSHSLKQEMDSVEKLVLEASRLFTSIKSGDKQNLRKLWQWFLTDPSRLQTAMKSCRNF